MESAKIRFFLITPIASWSQKPLFPLYLDSILSYAWLKGRGYNKTPAELHDDELIEVDLPLKKEQVDGKEYWAASAMFTPKGSYVVPAYITKHADWRQAVTLLAGGQFAYETGKGWMRAYQEPYWLLCASYLDFYVHGDIDKVIDLLTLIKTIGYLSGKRHAGYGRINKIAITPSSEDRSMWYNGMPTRLSVGIRQNQGYLAVQGYTAPYWHPARQTLLCAAKGTVVARSDNAIQRE